MAKQTFTTGQVLTAAQMTSLQQTAMLGGEASAKTASYTLVAADAGTAISMSNASATTITVNTALFAAGDTVHITNLGAGVCTITAGTATVNSSASLALAQYESGFLDFTSTSAAIFVKGAGAAASSGGLTLISETTASAISSLSLSSIPSTYKQLYLTWHGIYHSTSGNFFNLRFNNNSSAGIYRTKQLAFSGNTVQSDNNSNTELYIGAPYAFGSEANWTTELEKMVKGYLIIDNYSSSTKKKLVTGWVGYTQTDQERWSSFVSTFNSTTAISSIDVYRAGGSGTFSNATDTSIRLYGIS